MNKNIVAIGGGGFGRDISSLLLEKYILSISKKDCPKICFLPTATGDDDTYIVRYYSVFTRLKCTPTHIEFFKRTLNIRNHILNQDIIFVGGGNTKSMLAVWRDWDMDNILKQAYNQGIVMSGVSAGAICWFTNGVSDSWDNELKIIPCLDIIKGTCCPHYDEEADRIPFVKKILKDQIISSCFSIEGGSALHFIDGKPFKNVSFKNNKMSYNVYYEKNQIIQNSYPMLQL